MAGRLTPISGLEDSMRASLSQRSLFLIISVFLISGLTAAQVRTTGQVSGTVLDPSGAVVADATVVMKQTNTGFAQTVQSNGSGGYVFPNLQPGVYQLTATAPGFATAVVNDIVVEAARIKDVSVQMKVGTATDTVQVSAEGAVLETTTNTLSTTINPDQVQDLPLNGRDILPLAQLVPGAQSGGDERFTTYNALPNGAVTITVDGISANSQRYRTSTTGFYTFAPLRLGAFDEVTVSTSELTADVGAEGSTQVRFVTKRGTNQFHGNAFWQAINSYFGANSVTNKALGLERPLQVLNDWGGSLGGPLWKNRLFFFVNFEGVTQNFSAQQTTQFPNATSQQGNFSYTGTDGNTHTVNLLTLAANNGFPSTINPSIAGMLTSVNQYVANGVVTPAPGLPYENVVNFTQTQPDKERYPTARLDFQISKNVAWHGSWDMWWRNISNQFVNYPGDPNKAGGFNSTYYVASNAVDWTISPHLINQANFGIQSNVEEFNPGNTTSVFQSQNNFIVQPAYLANQGQAATSGVFTPIIPNFYLPIPRNNPVWNIYDNLTWSRGNHTFTFGGDLRIANSHELEINNPPTVVLGLSGTDPALAMFNPSNFPSIDPGNNNQDLLNAQALYTTLVGRIDHVSGSSWVDTDSHQYQILGKGTNWEKQTVGGMYFQDSWRATPHFTLNYGFRWQFSGAIHNTNGLWTGPTISDLFGPSTALFQPGVLSANQNPQIHLRPDPYSGDFKQPSPNFGFAWNPTFDQGFLHKLAGGSNLVIRGGFAISHYDEGWVPLENVTVFGNPGPTQAQFLFAPSGGLPGAILGDSLNLNTFPTSFTFPQPMSEFFPGTSFGTVDPKVRSPYVESWNFGIQRKFPGNNVLEINYVGNHAVHMWMGYDLNETNIFENGFLKEFKNAQTNLSLNNGTTFADNTGVTGLVPLPIFDAAFGVSGAAPGGSNQATSFSTENYITLLQQGQAGALANQLATQAGGTFLCNMVGTALSPCAGLGLTGAGNYPANFFQLNPFAAGGFLTLLSDPGSSSYNALQVQLKHQTTYGLNLNANYAYAHSFTNRYLGDYFTADSALVNFVTLRNRSLSRGPSPYDFRHVFRTFLTYELPLGKGKPFRTGNFLDHVIGGWTVGSIVTIQSGRNFKLQGGTNTFNFSNGYWPNASDSGVVLSGMTVSELQSKVGVYPGPNPNEPAVFLPPSILESDGSLKPGILSPASTPGQLGQFIFLSGPRYFNTDISVVKSIPITERVKFNLYAEFLNAFNHASWNVLDNFSFKFQNNPAEYANVSSPTFPALSLANGPRNIQFRLQVSF
jgi:hypothetical protein